MRWLSSHAYQTALWVLSRHGRVLDAARTLELVRPANAELWCLAAESEDGTGVAVVLAESDRLAYLWRVRKELLGLLEQRYGRPGRYGREVAA